MSVVVLGVIAAIVSYKHMYLLVRRYGDLVDGGAAARFGDGTAVASSMSLLLDFRNGRRSGLLPWMLLILGSVASLAAIVAVAEPSGVGRLVAGWPSCALIGSYELLSFRRAWLEPSRRPRARTKLPVPARTAR